MRFGVVFPQVEVGPDVDGVKAFSQAVEELGYSHLLAYDHVLGAEPGGPTDSKGAYNSSHTFHEVFVLFGYLSGITSSLELVTGILILPQRETALVAKQAASIDRLSGGRLRLGIGVGWNKVEYEALNSDFHNRGRRSEEQIEVLRELWTQETVTFDGRWHHIDHAGINPRPVQTPIPIWIGGYSDATMDRVGRLGDGWFPGESEPNDDYKRKIEKIHKAAEQAGRDPAEIGIDARISLTKLPESEWSNVTEAWREAGATHLSVVTMGGQLSVSDQIDLIRRYRELTS